MAYTRHTWGQGPTGNTPITHTKLNEMEVGISDAHTDIRSLTNRASSNDTINQSQNTRLTSLETRAGNLSSDIQALGETVTTHTSSIESLTSSSQTATSNISGLQSAVSSLQGSLSSVSDLSNSVQDLAGRVSTIEQSGGGGGGGSASLTVTQFTNTGNITIANNAWNMAPALSNWSSYTQPGDISLVNNGSAPGIMQVLRAGLYIFSASAADTQNPSGQQNFFVEIDRTTDANGSAVSSVLARFQNYSTNQGAGTAILSLDQGWYLRMAFRQNATGGSMILPGGINAIANNTQIGLALRFVKVG